MVSVCLVMSNQPSDNEDRYTDMKASMDLRHDLGFSDVPPRDGTAAPWTPRRGARLRPTVCSQRTTLARIATCIPQPAVRSPASTASRWMSELRRRVSDCDAA